jgi:hypothetical protein
MLYSQINSPYNVTNACWVEPGYNLQTGVRITVTLPSATKCAFYENYGAVAFHSRDSA